MAAAGLHPKVIAGSERPWQSLHRRSLHVQKIAAVRPPSGQPETTSMSDWHRAFDDRKGGRMIVMAPDLHRG
jgi:hypothetical protein